MRLAFVLVGLVLLAGCARGSGSGPVQPPTGDGVQAPAPEPVAVRPPEPAGADLRPAPQDPPSAGLLPKPETPYAYHLSDGTAAEEYYVRDGGRLIGAYNGKTYVTWFITDQGVWRRDPKGPGLLRYLPPEPKDQLAWKQRSGDADVWFLLREKLACQHGQGPDLERCWELTVLNRLERTTYELAPGNALPPNFIVETQGINRVRSDNLLKPAESYTKERNQAQPMEVPPREQLLQEGATWPEGPAPAVMAVTPAEFAAADAAMLTGAGIASLEIDLNNDGRKERIEGKLGEWHTGPLQLMGADGRPLWVFHRWLEKGMSHRLDVVSLPGIDRPTLIYQIGRPDSWHSIMFRWLHEGLVGPQGIAPKTDIVSGAGVAVEPDGTVAITNNPAELAGYTLTRRFRLEPTSDSWHYRATLREERAVAGAYPGNHADLLTAAFVADWFGRADDLARYIPDPATRAAFQGQVPRAPYSPARAQVGKLEFKKGPAPIPSHEKVPEIQPAPVAADGPTFPARRRGGRWRWRAARAPSGRRTSPCPGPPAGGSSRCRAGPRRPRAASSCRGRSGAWQRQDLEAEAEDVDEPGDEPGDDQRDDYLRKRPAPAGAGGVGGVFQVTVHTPGQFGAGDHPGEPAASNTAARELLMPTIRLLLRLELMTRVEKTQP